MGAGTSPLRPLGMQIGLPPLPSKREAEATQTAVRPLEVAEAILPSCQPAVDIGRKLQRVAFHNLSALTYALNRF
jgi:hypothetical protein